MNAADPTAGGMLQDWITIPGFLWLVLGCIAATCLGTVIVQFIRVWQETGAEMDAFLEAEKDDRLTRDVARYHCAGNGHKYMQEGDQWLCAHCGDVVRRPLNCGGFHRYETSGQSLLCTVCGFRSALPYDQEASA